MNNDDLIDEWDKEDYEVFNQWDEEAKNKRLEELEEYFKSDMEIRAKLLIKIDGLNYSLEQAYKDIKELQEENKKLKKHRDIMIKSYDDETKKYYDIIKEAIDYVEHISNVDIDWHEQDRIINILRKCDNE